MALVRDMDAIGAGLRGIKRRRVACAAALVGWLPISALVDFLLGPGAAFAAATVYAAVLASLVGTLYWMRCPRCGDAFFHGALRAASPELGRFSLWRSKCVYCGLSLRAGPDPARPEGPPNDELQRTRHGNAASLAAELSVRRTYGVEVGSATRSLR